MKILSLDSATESASCAILEDEKLLCELTFNNKKQHSVILMPMIDTLLKTMGLSVSDLDGFVVSKGPGSFTGLRIGTAVIKGLAQGANKPFVSVSTLDSLAYNMAYTEGIICPIIDALRDNVYTALYKYRKEKLEILLDHNIIHIDELILMLKNKEMPICFIGDGVYKFREKLTKELPQSIFAPSQLNLARASSLGELGLKLLNNGVSENIYSFAPVYLRQSQAEREYQKKLEKIEHE